MSKSILNYMQNYCFNRKPNNSRVPIIAGNKKLTTQIKEDKEITII